MPDEVVRTTIATGIVAVAAYYLKTSGLLRYSFEELDVNFGFMHRKWGSSTS